MQLNLLKVMRISDYTIQSKKRGALEYQFYSHKNINKSDFFDIIYADQVFALRPHVFLEMHAHGFYLLSWNFNNYGIQEVDFTQYEMEEDYIFLLSPVHLHRFIGTTEPKGVSLVFSDDILAHIDSSMQNTIRYEIFTMNAGGAYCKVPNKETKEELLHLIDLINMELNNSTDVFGHTARLAALLLLFLITLKRKCIWKTDINKNANSQEGKIYKDFCHYVENNYRKIHIVKEYAAMMGISLTVLNYNIKKYSQTTPLKIINHRLILEAKRLIRYTPLRIKEISAELGFEDPSYFVKLFKRLTGMLPADFREMH